LISSGRIEAQWDKLHETVDRLKNTLVEEEEKKRQFTEGAERLTKETADLISQLEATKGSNRV
jgi:hypothetical protein